MTGNLQSRLDNVFGALNSGDNTIPSWKPSPQHVFRDGGAEGTSEDEEFDERARHEVQPGIPLDFLDNNVSDEEGFMPSAAFCRQVDREPEEDMADAWACQTGEDRRPKPGTEVLDDNAYESKLSLSGSMGALRQYSSQNLSMVSSGSRGSLTSLPSRSSLRQGSRVGQKKRVSFDGISEPWIPPHRRPGFKSRSGDQIGLTGGVPEPISPVQHTGGVPGYVTNPDSYIRYDLEHPLIVGGGVGQPAAEEKHDVLALAMDGEHSESTKGDGLVERWQGGPGAGIVQFRSKLQKEGAPSVVKTGTSDTTPRNICVDWPEDHSDEDGDHKETAMETQI